MLDFIYDSLLQICEGVQGKAEIKEKKMDYQHCKECDVERMMYPDLRFYVYPSCGVFGNDVFVIRYDESSVMHKKRKCIYKRDEYFQLEIGKFFCRELLKIPNSVM